MRSFLKTVAEWTFGLIVGIPMAIVLALVVATSVVKMAIVLAVAAPLILISCLFSAPVLVFCWVYDRLGVDAWMDRRFPGRVPEPLRVLAPAPEIGTADWRASIRVREDEDGDWVIENDWHEYCPEEPIVSAEAAWRWVDQI